MWSLALAFRTSTMVGMQLIQPSHVIRPARGPLVLGTIVGGILLFGGLALTWLAIATPLISGLTPSVVRPSPAQMAIGAAIWGVSLVAPPAFAIVGAFRLSQVASTILQRPHVGAVRSVAAQLGDEYVVAPLVHLADGRAVRNLVVGPFGMAILSELPTPKVSRRHGPVWEVRRYDGRWIPLVNPLETAARDAERVRRWISGEERDFLVKVYAAVVTSDPTISRTPACATVQREQIPAWLAALPPQRSLTDSRRSDLVERVRSIA
jgi:hypothetical protein